MARPEASQSWRAVRADDYAEPLAGMIRRGEIDPPDDLVLEDLRSELTTEEAADSAIRALGDCKWAAGDPCGACGSNDTYGYAGNAGCNACRSHDQDGG